MTALVELRAAVQANPNRYPARFDIASILIHLGRTEEAREELLALLEAVPDYADALALLAGLEANSGDWRSAEQLLERAVTADPDSERVHARRGDLFLTRGVFVEALEAYDRALALDPTLVTAIVGRAFCLVNLERPQEATEFLEQSRIALPTRSRLALAAAHVYLAAGSDAAVAKAAALARQAMSISPTVSAARILAAVSARTGRFDDAVRWQSNLLSELESADTSGRYRERAEQQLARYSQGRWQPVQFDFETLEELLHTMHLDSSQHLEDS